MKVNHDIVLYDLETAYTVAAVWGLFDTNVAKVLREPFIISCAWKYLNDKVTHVIALPDFKTYKKNKFSDKELVQELWKIFNNAKILIAHNGNSYDYKWVYGRFAVHGIEPPDPSKNIDTLLIARNKFKFNSNRLNDLGGYFGIGKKIETGGIDLWYKCIELSDKKSWSLMKKYNSNDVVLLEKVYNKLLPFITNHPNLALMSGEPHACPNCGSKNMIKRGFAFTRVFSAQRWKCKDCNSWHQSSIKLNQVR